MYLQLANDLIIETDNHNLWPDGVKLPQAEGKRKMRAIALKKLREVIEPGDTIYTVLRHVSRSGMQRRIDLYTIGDDKRLFFLSGYVSDALDIKRHHSKDGLVVNGCGMDMGYHLVHNLSQTLFCPDKYNHDAAFSLKHEWI